MGWAVENLKRIGKNFDHLGLPKSFNQQSSEKQYHFTCHWLGTYEWWQYQSNFVWSMLQLVGFSKHAPHSMPCHCQSYLNFYALTIDNQDLWLQAPFFVDTLWRSLKFQSSVWMLYSKGIRIGCLTWFKLDQTVIFEYVWTNLIPSATLCPDPMPPRSTCATNPRSTRLHRPIPGTNSQWRSNGFSPETDGVFFDQSTPNGTTIHAKVMFKLVTVSELAPNVFNG